MQTSGSFLGAELEASLMQLDAEEVDVYNSTASTLPRSCNVAMAASYLRSSADVSAIRLCLARAVSHGIGSLPNTFLPHAGAHFPSTFHAPDRRRFPSVAHPAHPPSFLPPQPASLSSAPPNLPPLDTVAPATACRSVPSQSRPPSPASSASSKANPVPTPFCNPRQPSELLVREQSHPERRRPVATGPFCGYLPLCLQPRSEFTRAMSRTARAEQLRRFRRKKLSIATPKASIRYASRKRYADSRPRVNGRFIRKTQAAPAGPSPCTPLNPASS